MVMSFHTISTFGVFSKLFTLNIHITKKFKTVDELISTVNHLRD